VPAIPQYSLPRTDHYSFTTVRHTVVEQEETDIITPLI
jgi:hypothetical protein